MKKITVNKTPLRKRPEGYEITIKFIVDPGVSIRTQVIHLEDIEWAELFAGTLSRHWCVKSKGGFDTSMNDLLDRVFMDKTFGIEPLIWPMSTKYPGEVAPMLSYEIIYRSSDGLEYGTQIKDIQKIWPKFKLTINEKNKFLDAIDKGLE